MGIGCYGVIVLYNTQCNTVVLYGPKCWENIGYKGYTRKAL